MNRTGIPVMKLLVFGDWHTVISSRKYRDLLIDQRPDEYMAEWHQYRIECSTIAELVEAYNEFHGRLKMHCDFGFTMQTENREIGVEVITGYAGDDRPQCFVAVNEPASAIAAAAQEAIRILTEATK